MSFNFSRHTLAQYLNRLSTREPVPGGGSAAAYTAALGAGLLSMVANYSKGRRTNTKAIELQLAKSLKASEAISKRLLDLTTLDSSAYLEIIAARQRDKKAQTKASHQAAKVGMEICRLCYKAMELTPFLVKQGNPYLVSDVKVAVELLQAGFNGSMVMVKVNQ